MDTGLLGSPYPVDEFGTFGLLSLQAFSQPSVLVEQRFCCLTPIQHFVCGWLLLGGLMRCLGGFIDEILCLCNENDLTREEAHSYRRFVDAWRGLGRWLVVVPFHLLVWSVRCVSTKSKND